MPMTKSVLSPPSLNLLQSPIPWLWAFWKFSRPYTVLGTSLSVWGVFAMAWVVRHPLGLHPGTFHVWQGASSLWLTWLACVCANLYIVGLNQIEDVATDRIDKPYLPIASGEFSAAQAKMLVGIACSGAILLAAVSQSFYLVVTIGLSLILGTAYSLPPLQLKRLPLWGPLCQLLVRGAVVTLGIFLHACSQLGLRSHLPGQVWVLMLVVLVLSGAIAVLKHLCDGNPGFTTSASSTKALRLVWWLLTLCYSGLIIGAAVIPAINSKFLIATHGLALVYFWYLSRQVQSDPTDADTAALSHRDYYQFIWKLLFVEYLIFPTACLLYQV